MIIVAAMLEKPFQSGRAQNRQRARTSQGDKAWLVLRRSTKISPRCTLSLARVSANGQIKLIYRSDGERGKLCEAHRHDCAPRPRTRPRTTCRGRSWLRLEQASASCPPSDSWFYTRRSEKRRQKQAARQGRGQSCVETRCRNCIVQLRNSLAKSPSDTNEMLDIVVG